MPYDTFKEKENSGYLSVNTEGGATAYLYETDRYSTDFWTDTSFDIGGQLNKNAQPTDDKDSYQDPDESSNNDEQAIFEDDSDTCTASFKTNGELMRHILSGKHKITLQLHKVNKIQYNLINFRSKILLFKNLFSNSRK